MALIEYQAWGRTTRVFHWVNFFCVLGLIVFGLVIQNAEWFGIEGPAEIPFKRIHSIIGYVFVVNLLWRLIWAFIGDPRARWSALLPGGRGYAARLRDYLGGMRSGNPPAYIGHNPLGRVSVTLLLLLLLVQGATGLVLAGTDLYLPPFGRAIAARVAAPGVDPAAVRPGVPELVDPEKRNRMRSWRGPIAEIHEVTFFLLLAVIALHLIAVVRAELGEQGRIVSAMINGRKVLDRTPVDTSDQR